LIAMLTSLSATQMAARLSAGDTTSRELAQAHLARIEAGDAAIHAFTSVQAEQVLLDAARLDAERAAGRVRSALHGVPVTLKECFDIAGEATTLGIVARKDRRAPKDAALVTLLREAGALLLGRTNLSQTMLFVESRNPLFGETKNPHRLDRTPGGSSGGEAAAIAAGMSPLGVGTDIGGSIRIPAHFCGIAGFKPTLDRLPMQGYSTGVPGQEGVRGMAGPMARRVADLELFMAALDPVRANALDGRVPPLAWRGVDAAALRGLRVGMIASDGIVTPDGAIRRALARAAEALRDAGCEVVDYHPLHMQDAAFRAIALIGADGGETLHAAIEGGPLDPVLQSAFNATRAPGWKRFIMQKLLLKQGDVHTARLVASLGKKTPAQLFKLVAEVRAWRAEVVGDMQSHGIALLLSPPYPIAAFPHGGSKGFTLGGSYAMFANALQLPAGVVPVTTVREGEEDDVSGSGLAFNLAKANAKGSIGLPVGVQVIGLPWQDEWALAAMQAIETRVMSDEGFPVVPVVA